MVTKSKGTIEQLLEIVGTEQDIAQYRSVYKGNNEPKCAVIKIGGEVIQNELSVLVNALGFFKSFGLFPIVVHGAGPQLNAYLKKDSSYEPQYAQGMRVTDAYVLQAARKIFLQTNLELASALWAEGHPATSIAGGLFGCTQLDPEIGLVGDVTEVHTSLLSNCIATGSIPVILPLAESAEGQIMNINADVAAREVSKALKPHKTIFVNAKGGWIEDDGTKLKSMDLQNDFDKYMDRDWTGRQGTLLKLKELKHILDFLPPGGSIALTSASGLVSEVLSHRGVGTLVKFGKD